MKIRSSYLWAGLVALGVVGWMVSDDLLRPQADDAGVEISSSDVNAIDAPKDDGDSSAGTVPQPASVERSFIVSALRVKNETIPRLIRANGIIEPEYEVTVSSKIDGNIVAVPGREGASVKAGDVLVVLDKDTLPAQIAAARAEIQAAEMALNAAREQSRGTLEEELAAAEANLAVAKKRMEISKKLAQQNFSAPLEQVQLKADFENARVTLAKIRLKQNFQADIEVSQNTARLEAARSNLSVLTSQLDDSTIVAPIDGRLETIHVDAGERLRRDQAAATILGMDRLSVVVAVPQTNVSRISIGDMVKVDIAGAGTHQGQVAKIASQTSAATRTFDVEITVPNDEGRLRAGVTVEAAIDIGSVNAFAMSPAHLSVAGDGSLTAKVSDSDTVRIIPVEMVRSGAERVYVSGLEDGMILLTVGQAFVDAGDTVNYALGDNS
ncbi:MAG: efflux RND transporter periplasmic adaptor subunit [Alphaproteobacteria bacterium]|jgi:multidrug efflux system membrane fusion protein